MHFLECLLSTFVLLALFPYLLAAVSKSPLPPGSCPLKVITIVDGRRSSKRGPAQVSIGVSRCPHLVSAIHDQSIDLDDGIGGTVVHSPLQLRSDRVVPHGPRIG